MNPVELFHADGKSSGAFYCGKCGVIWKGRDAADRCCAPYKCDRCGKETARYWTRCDNCRAEDDAKKEAERFEKAEKLADWDGPLYYADRYYDDLEGFFDEMACDGEDLPDYLWCCSEHPAVILDWGSILENAMQEVPEGMDTDDLNGLEEFKKAIEAFNEANKGVVMWNPNFKKAVLIPKEKEKK